MTTDAAGGDDAAGSTDEQSPAAHQDGEPDA